MTVVSAAAALVWVAGFWALSRDTAETTATTLAGALASMLAVGLAAGQIWPRIAAGYPGDSYWTLNWVGHTGVVTISLVGIAMLFLALAAKTRLVLGLARGGPGMIRASLDGLAGLLIFAVVFSVSPQVFYTFYQLIIPGLPSQLVVDTLIDTDRLTAIARLDPQGSLADHLAGITFWAILPFTLWLHLRHGRHRDEA